MLSERDRHILVLLQQGMTSPASVAAALGVSYAAAAKAIQRVKERIAAILGGGPTAEQVPMSPHPCESESGG
jgi:DNA-directed RNA polymerase specialized sigma24 family protein